MIRFLDFYSHWCDKYGYGLNQGVLFSGMFEIKIASHLTHGVRRR